jgi:hypothetical protein
MTVSLCSDFGNRSLIAFLARFRARAPFGLPSCWPRAFAACRARLVRSEITLRSCCARLAKIWIVSSLASGMSAQTNLTLLSCISAMNLRLRLRRSSLAITKIDLPALHYQIDTSSLQIAKLVLPFRGHVKMLANSAAHRYFVPNSSMKMGGRFQNPGIL